MSDMKRADIRPLWHRSKLGEALAARLSGPGGYYNAGNALGFVVGLFLAVRLAPGDENAGVLTSLEAAGRHLAGDWSAAALTVATVVFFWSGEVYRRAWDGGSPDEAGIRRGDLLSGAGCLALAASLLLLGNPILAAISGLLSAGGKFGNAFRLGANGHGPFGLKLPQLFRAAVLVSRLPAIGIAVIEIARVLGGTHADLFHALAIPVTLFVCCLLWSRADILLFNK